jgi:hypothetical protein
VQCAAHAFANAFAIVKACEAAHGKGSNAVQG